MKPVEIAVIGAGASGLMAAYCAADALKTQKVPGRVLLLEGNNRPGKKLLATGNGRCNLSNQQLTAAAYFNRALTPLLTAVSPARIISLFQNMGLLCRTDGEGRIYPYNLQAAAVLKALRTACEALGVLFITQCDIASLRPAGSGFLLEAADGQTFRARRCILATGGKAAPKHSCNTENGYAMAVQLGHTVTPCRPALVPLCTPAPMVRKLKGCRAKAAVALRVHGEVLHREKGEMIFGQNTLSGICIFNLSAFLPSHHTFSKDKPHAVQVLVDFAPELRHENLLTHLKALQQHFPARPCMDALSGVLNMQLGEVIMQQLGFGPHLPLGKLTPTDLDHIVEQIKSTVFDITATAGFEKAQVTAGGVPLTEVCLSSMESRRHHGLYLCGELLDVHGQCGGYNLHFAFASGYLAGTSAAQTIPYR